jgi:pimeloyl-ACP methyl ester carboxylesterase
MPRRDTIPAAAPPPGRLVGLDDGGAGETLILVHGLATTRGIWCQVSPGLRATRRVVALDVPGFGTSPAAGPGFDLRAVAARIVEGLAAAGVPVPYDLVGHSLGGGLALVIAAARPEDVRRLVLVAPAGLSTIPRPIARALGVGATGALAARRSLAPLTDLGWGRRLLLSMAASDGARLAPGEARRLVGASAGAARTAAAFAAIATADLRPLLVEASVPLGVIWGAADRTIAPSGVDRIREYRPDACVRVIERAGHIVMAERPTAFRTALDELLGCLAPEVPSPLYNNFVG